MFDIKSIASFPLKYEKEVIGALTVYSNIENYFLEDIIDVLVEISCNISIGIRKFIDKQKIMDKTKELEKTIDNMLSSFSKIVSLKEPYTGNHSIRVSNLAFLIGKEMRLSEDSLIALKYASFLHDLGKIFVPSEILNKYGKLTSHEFNLVKEHVLKSFEIVKDINFPYPTHEIILQHHERIDGSGYPNGLKGNEILLEAKILAVADVVDAMLSDRPYRAKLNLKDVIEELNKNKDVKYDKKVVEATLKVLKSFNQSESENRN
ncbi:MAG: HD domain-containing phosphohydrolase [Caldisericia bacterium]